MRSVELFAGGGGAAAGIRAAGFHHLAAVEMDPVKCATLRANGLRVVEERVEHFTDYGPGVVDLLWASPPCQPFSSMGKRGGACDARNGWPATLAQVKRLRPKWVVVENVRGAPVESWARSLQATGYTVSSWKLNAADYGVAQHRVRLFLVAGPYAVSPPEKSRHIPASRVAPSLHGKWLQVGTATARARSADLHPSPALMVKPNMYVHTHDTGVRRTGDKLPPDSRMLTTREAIRLAGFGDHWKFTGTDRQIYAMVGNAVPPPLAYAIARTLR